MVIFKIDSDYADEEFLLLGRHLRLLDIEISRINAAIALSQDPETDGLCDAGEYFIGSGFVAVQRYLTAARSACSVSLADAFIVPPMLTGGLSFAAAINAAANYWKHMEEWIVTLNKSDEADLHRSAQRTLQQIETITPWEEYTCANLLAVLVKGQELELSGLLPEISQWRHNLMTRLSPKSE